MRILVTGATGFAGRWLIRELETSGHLAIAAPQRRVLDVADGPAMTAYLRTVAPDAIAHLAGIAYGPDARKDPDLATAVNVGGTRAVLEAAATVGPDLAVLVVSSSEVYGRPSPEDLPLRETAALRADQPYGTSKVGLEQVAVAAMSHGDRRIAIVRPFNHTGPGQRLEFVVPALARRVIAARSEGRTSIVAGNLDVRRDFSDVRDVVRAYRLILEALWRGELTGGSRPPVFNIATGRSTAIRDIATAFGEMAGIELEILTDPELVRPDDPPDIRGDASRIATELDWRPTIAFDVTLRDVFADVMARVSTPI